MVEMPKIETCDAAMCHKLSGKGEDSSTILYGGPVLRL
jgi:hypothetical protein